MHAIILLEKVCRRLCYNPTFSNMLLCMENGCPYHLTFYQMSIIFSLRATHCFSTALKASHFGVTAFPMDQVILDLRKSKMIFRGTMKKLIHFCTLICEKNSHTNKFQRCNRKKKKGHFPLFTFFS